jgi:hypothetical protein
VLSRAAPGRPKLIVSKSVYSMDGDIAPLETICGLIQQLVDAMISVWQQLDLPLGGDTQPVEQRTQTVAAGG